MEELRSHDLLEVTVLIDTVIVFNELNVWQIWIIVFFNQWIGLLILSL